MAQKSALGSSGKFSISVHWKFTRSVLYFDLSFSIETLFFQLRILDFRVTIVLFHVEQLFLLILYVLIKKRIETPECVLCTLCRFFVNRKFTESLFGTIRPNL